MTGRSSLLGAIAVSLTATALLTGCAGHTLDATDVHPTSAMLNATGQCDYGCNVRFRYHEVSPTLNGFSYTPAKPIPGGAKGNFSLPVSGLTPGATYHFQICGTDADVQGEPCTGPTEDGSSYSRFVTPQPMRLETYNVQYFKQLDGGRDDYPASTDAIEKIKDDINASGATVVALEEVRQFGSDIEAKRLADALGWKGTGTHYYYAGWPGDPNGCSKNPACTSKGVALISAFPITGADHRSIYLDHGLDRQLIWGDVNLDNGKKVRVYATHLAAISEQNITDKQNDEKYVIRQINEKALPIIKFTMAASGLSKAVFIGDFNLPYDSYVASQGGFNQLTSYGFHDWKADRISLSDPCAAPYYACTYSNFDSHGKPSAATDKRDYVWVKGYSMTAGRVDKYCTSTGCDSDHRPYWTDVIP